MAEIKQLLELMKPHEDSILLAESEPDYPGTRHLLRSQRSEWWIGESFPPGSVIRQVGREALTLLGGGRAVLLQLAHPLVAAGVMQHSDFRSDPLSRLLRTLALMHTLVFGTRRHVRRALRRFQAAHARVRGRLPQAVGPFAAGTPYSAGDPELNLWVHATLVDTSLLTYERFVRPLSREERGRYYADTRLLAQRLDIPDQCLPPSLPEFRGYVADMLAGDRLAVDDRARRLAWDVLHPRNVGPVPSASASLLRFVTAGLLPPRLRRAFGLKWGPGRQALLDALSRTTRLLRPVAPVWAWVSPLLRDGLARRLLWGATQAGGEPG
jgi:uncharacterized protein (DUF2236 family)